MLLKGAGIRDLPYGPEDRTVKVKDEYKEEAMPGRCGNIVSCGIRDGPLKTSRLSVKKRGKEAGGKWRSGRGSVC